MINPTAALRRFTPAANLLEFCLHSAACLLLLLIPLRVGAQSVTITTQLPLTQNLAPGASLNLSVAVNASEPVTYTWLFNGIAIPGVSGSSFQLSSVTLADAGTYSVRVNGLSGFTVTGRACVVDINGPGGTVNFSNAVQRRQVFDIDGTTPVAGDEYLAQLYAGPNAGSLVPVGAATPFGTGAGAGYWRGGTRSIPGIAPGAPCVTQVRVWQSGRGKTFEEASRVAGKFGISAPVSIPATGGAGTPPTLPATLAGFASFALSTLAPPVIITPPANLSVALGSPATLSVTAGGGAPLGYQWQFNGTDIPNATAASYQIPSATAAHSGSYRVRISNSLGSVLSAFATLSVESPGGTVQFSNAQARAPVRAADGVTLLAGDDYLAQLFAGPPGGPLVPVSGAVPFGTGAASGYWKGAVRSVPGLAPGSQAQVQARVWPVSAGSSFDAAVQAGQPVGLSAVLTVTLGGVGSPPTLPATLSGLLPFNLGAQLAPQIVQELAPVSLVAGQPGKLEVTAVGLPPLTFEWRRNGTVVANQTGPILNFPAVQASTAGSYSVTVRNAHGEDSSGPVTVGVVFPPVISQPPAPQLVATGTPVTFSVQVTGTAPFTYQWRFNNNDIPGATAATHTLAAAQTANDGNYSVRVSNAAGSATSTTARLTVLTPPAIATQPADLTVNAGQPASLSVTANGSAPLSFQWEKNGKTIPGATASTLPLGEATPETAGSYRVRISNPVGSVVSRFATVTVNGPGGTVQFANAALRTPVTAEDGTTLLAGDDFLAQLYAGPSPAALAPVPGAVPFGTAAAAGYWRGASRSLPGVTPGNRVFVQARVWETSAGATFEEAVGAGRPVGLSLVVEVTTGGAGLPPTLPAAMTGLLPFSLSRNIAPVITTPLTPGVAIFGQPFELNVAAFGLEPMTYEWRRNGSVVGGQTGRTLPFPSANDDTAGSYAVTVRNAHGQASSGPVTVTVVRPPSITTPPAPQLVATGTRVTFSVGVTGTAPFTYQWRFENSDIPGANAPTYTLASAQPANDGNYSVRVSNAGGSATSASARLTVLNPPAIAVQPADITVNTGDVATLSVTANGSGPLSFQWEKNGKPIAGPATATLPLGNATADIAGSYRVRISNPVGQVVSRFATVTVNGPGGTVQFANAALRTPVTAEDGTTLLAGDDFLAQLYAGPSPAALAPVPGAVPFGSAAAAGYWRGASRSLPGVTPGNRVFVQARVWETSAGATFEEAVAAGRPVGFSAALEITTGGAGVPPSLPAPLTGLLPFSLTRNIAPTITTPPAPGIAIFGQPFQLTVAAVGLEPMTYEWRRNGSILPSQVGPTLVLNPAGDDAGGSYDVTVRNAFGEARSTPAAVTLIYPPAITTPPAPQVAVLGTPATFQVQATGTAPLTFQWRRDGNDIPNANSAAFQIPAATPELEGNYTVRISNAGGSIESASARLTVIVPPSIASHPSDFTGSPGSQPVLAVGVAGSAPFEFQWELNGQPIPGATAATLTLNNAQPAASGSYRARVRNAAGATVSRFAVVVINPDGAGTVQFSNAVLRAPVSAEDGTTPLAGDRYLAQLFAGTDAFNLLPVQGPAPFLDSPSTAGFWRSGTRTLAGIAPGTRVFAQVRVWETDAGASFDDAFRAGRPVGISATVELVTGGAGVPPTLPAPLTGLTPFSLRQWTVPGIATAPLPLTVQAGQPAEFSVVATGSQPLSYQWTLGETDIPGATAPTYRIPSAQPANEGLYKVRIHNPVGGITSAPVALTVLAKPSFVVQPTPATAPEGAPVDLTAQADGAGPIQYRWQRNGSDIPGAGSATFSIPQATPESSGVYRVMASNAHGETASASVVVNVIGSGGTALLSNAAARALITDLDRTTPLAGDAWLAQLYAGTSAFDLQPVPGATFLGTGAAAGYLIGGTRTVPFFAPGTRAHLQVRVWERSAGPNFESAIAAGRPVAMSTIVDTVLGGLGTPPTVPATLTTLEPFSLETWAPPAFTSVPAPQSVILGQPFSLVATVTGSTPMAFSWTRNGTPLDGATTPRIDVTAAAGTDAGSYVLTAVNPLGRTSSIPVNVTVIHPPFITTHPAPLLVAQGAPAAFSVTATGTEPFTYQWFLNGEPIPDASASTFNLAAAQPANQGNYTVRVSNPAGSALSNPAQLVVAGLPVITLNPAPQSILAGTTARFTVAAEVTGSASYAWLRNGEPIPGASSPVLEIPNVRTADAGEYRARVSSVAGSADSTAATLSVFTLPVIEEFPTSLVVAEGDPVNLRVVASGSAPLSYEWSRNGSPIPDAIGDTLSISAAATSDAGSYQVRVSNSHGAAVSPAFTLDVDASFAIGGVAVDGYISGATVFFDADRDSFLDPGEPFAITDDKGRFDLDVPLGRFDTNKNGRIDAAEGRLVRIGGVDIATGLVSDIPAIGPAGSEVLGPLSSLIDAMQSSRPDLTVEEAERLVSSALGLPPGLPLTKLDPIDAAAQNLPGAVALISAAAQVQDTLVQVVSLIDGAAGGSVTAADHFLDALAGRVLDNQTVNLTEPGEIGDLLNKTIEKEGIELPAAIVDAATQVVVEGNAAKEAAAESGDPLEIAALISRIQSVVQGSTAGDLAEAGAGNKDESELLQKHTGENLAQQVQEAPEGDLLGTETRAGTFTLSATTARILEDGTTVESLSVIRSDGNRGPIRVLVAVAPGSATVPGDLKAGPLFLDFADGELVKSVDLAALLVDDAEPETEESFALTLHLATGAPASAKLGTATQAAVTLDDDDRAGTFQFDGTALQMNEDGTFVRRLFVERTGGLKGTVTVSVSTRALDGGARPGIDFQPTNARLTFAPGQRLAQVLVPVVDDSLFEGTERVGIDLAIAQPSSPGAALGQRTSAELEILNNDRRQPNLRFTGRAGDTVNLARMRISGPPGQRIGIETSGNLLDWKTEPDAEIGPDGILELPFSIETPADQTRFVRFGPKR